MKEGLLGERGKYRNFYSSPASSRRKLSRPLTPTKDMMMNNSKRQQMSASPDLTPTSVTDDDYSFDGLHGEGRRRCVPCTTRKVSLGGLSTPSLVEECEEAMERSFSSLVGEPCSPCKPAQGRVISPLVATDPIEIDGTPPPFSGFDNSADNDAGKSQQQEEEGAFTGTARAREHVRRHSTGGIDDEAAVGDDGVEPPPCFFGVPSSPSVLGLHRSHSLTDASEFKKGERLAAAYQGRMCRSEGDGADDGRSPSPALRKFWKGDIGLALFSPLDLEAFEPLKSGAEPESCVDQQGDLDRSAAEEEGEDVEEELHLVVLPEPLCSLKSSPRILTESMMRQIRDRGLHPTVQLMSWHRAYSLSRDGDSFHTMLRLCEGYNHTVFALRTIRGHILGGYADKPWSRQAVVGKTFYGSGRAFLFATDPALEEDCDQHQYSAGGDDSHRPDIGSRRKTAGGVAFEGDGDRIHLYKWTGDNTYSQIFDAEGEHMAMGGGGSFGIIVEENFTRGSTGRCATFGNPPLTKDCGGCFDICDFEVYGLRSSLAGSFSMMF